ncbi:MAG: spore germination protein [Clostridia bacterium]|nr:spore germination protein [Clostridia bacterium]
MKFENNLQKNIQLFKNVLKSDDIIYYQFSAKQSQFCVIYVDSVTDKNEAGKLVIKAIQEQNITNLEDCQKKLQIPAVEKSLSVTDTITALLQGKTILLGAEKFCLTCDFYSYQMRAVAEPPTSTIVRGPREGFNESIKTNLSLVRRRIKTPDFIVKNFQVGKYSKTQISLCYLSSIAPESLVNDVIAKLSSINIDSVPDSSYISKLIIKRKTSLFKQIGNTEKPDIFSQKLLEGRVGILVDGSPIALTLPYMFVEDFQSSEDYFINNYRANMVRAIRVISLIIAVLLPAIFVSAQLFHLQVIPLNFLLTIVSSIKGIPLSPSFEMFFTLLIFEILNEASVRMPKYVGMALSIVGALVLGDTAVKAGIVSTPTIMIMALSGICLYTAPEVVDSMSVLRLVFLIIAGTLGGYGVIMLATYIIIYLCSLDNFGVPFLAPYAPFISNDLKDSLYMDFVPNMKKRPKVLGSDNKTRMGAKNNEKTN